MFNMQRLSANNVANSATKISIFCRITKLALLIFTTSEKASRITSAISRYFLLLLVVRALFSRCIIVFLLIINSLHLKKVDYSKIYLFFLRKIEDLTFFFINSLRTEGKKGKNSLLGPRQTSSVKIGHVGVYFAQKGCKIEDGFTDILGFQLWRYCV